jgi:hypothetical protein
MYANLAASGLNSILLDCRCRSEVKSPIGRDRKHIQRTPPNIDPLRDIEGA